MRVGFGVSSAIIKYVVLNDDNQIAYQSYERHFSQIVEKMAEFLRKIQVEVLNGAPAYLSVSGLAGMGIAQTCDLPLIQEVYTTRVTMGKLIPDADVIIELGGEDTKTLFLIGGTEVRMNSSCVGGTGVFINQTATLLYIPLEEMDELAVQHEKIYTIASCCGVLAKSDVRPPLNQGVRKSDISTSIFATVANQTIAGLAQGHPIRGKVIYLDGPLTFLSELWRSFDTVLKVKGVYPENSLYYVAMDVVLSSESVVDLDTALTNMEAYRGKSNFLSIPSLFRDEQEYREFQERHQNCYAKCGEITQYNGKAYLGIDVGSITVKAVVFGEDCELPDSIYRSNSGDPVPIIREYLMNLYEQYPNLMICSSAVTGYDEELLKNAFNLDSSIVEAMVYFTTAKYFMPDVDFVIDIGG